MRKLSAILLIGVFAFSQYARQLSYLECKFSNLFKSAAVQCDCEKQAGFSQQEDDPAPVSNNHGHLHLDEFFIITTGTPPVTVFNPTLQGKLLHRDDDHCNGYHSPPWQPPNSIA